MDTPKVPRPVRKRRRAVEVDRMRELALQQMLDRLEQGELSVAELLKVIALEAPPQTEEKRSDGDWVLQLLEDPPDEGQ